MLYSEIKLQTLTLLGEIAEGSNTYSTDLIFKAHNWAQEQLCQALGLTYTELVTGITAVTGATGATGPAVFIPSDAIRVKRLQLWDNTMTDLIT